MARKTGIRLRDLTVRAEDCYDPADYVLVHENYLKGLRSAIQEAHRRLRQTDGPCSCVYCSPPTQSGDSNA